VLSHAPASKLLEKGVFKFSRNPMCLGMAMTYLGVALYRSNCWRVIFLPIAIVVIDRLVITREEAYLTLRFGKEYEEYKRSTMRWV